MTNIGTPDSHFNSSHILDKRRNEPVDDNWGGNSSSGPSRANSNERERESQSRKVLNIWQSRNKYKPPLRKQGTEEYDFQDDQAPDNEQDSGWRAQNNSASQSVSPEPTTRHWQAPAENQFNLRTKQKSRSTNTERGEIIRRPVTPVLKVNPDIPAAVPMPRTPMRLRSKVSLTARAVQDIVNKRSQRL
ncbi:uncharacterized protein Dwil_GK19690 [Drosophila willistoni]|uniref:Uncharacterized protein n=1 Tax=Drosophila willistoni TaxID=7260 RepID=A0A0Q9WPP4_DROWI|nr:uncharacterized protein Dwil_GK19690 [Drosophila willistoni]